jgi:hypothetical protein
MNGLKENKRYEMWDRLVLLLIARPQDGWEKEFKDITRREIERLTVPADEQDCGE